LNSPSPPPRHARALLRQTAESPVETHVLMDDNRRASLVIGLYDQNIAHIERRLDVIITVNGNRLSLRGRLEASEIAKAVIEGLYEQARTLSELTTGDVDSMIAEIRAQGVLFPVETPAPSQDESGFAEINTRKRRVRARNVTQNTYLRALRSHELVICEGPAGTGKTWLAVGHAVSLIEQGICERLILSRPAVEAGERLGFLPGDMREKVDPYLRPIYDALYDFMEARHVERALQTGLFEIAPLAFMRGRTLTNAVVLLDEAQNTTSMQMKMVLTRLGEGSRMIITGDPSQIDLPYGQKSGLVEAARILDGVEGIARIRFNEADVVRHELVKRIVTAYDADLRRTSQPAGPVSSSSSD
jgi:phosphate starvation-inducible PhoH-like protein